ncbi:hypothetical protein BDK51DRAFT_29174 [Blyttiomyces helicus]|uniref:EF-hand domain-containing protein n=1 Tax=Blyttiomyces helicus TaxID=388810 RepID=A0A4P9WKU6_9FUNG|nr:hypothetical protein BDK51DRAFT_29174 [Blyttiomyces helicus]|eukprot:RKO93629.1 hypothetical protein BDK51DRAFT_29174 [Blyttiomyces helicus]
MTAFARRSSRFSRVASTTLQFKTSPHKKMPTVEPSPATPAVSATSPPKPRALAGGQIEDAGRYLEKHRVPHILQLLTAALVQERPADPKDFLVRKLHDLRNAAVRYPSARLEVPTYGWPPLSHPLSRNKARGNPLTLFTRENLTALFMIFDVTGKGLITLEQYREAMKSIGAANAAQQPAELQDGQVSLEGFVEEGGGVLPILVIALLSKI